MSNNDEVILMGPVMEWPSEQGESPACNGSCSKGSWTLNPKTGYWVCPVCKKASMAYLRLCEICDKVYLVEPWPTTKIPNVSMPRVLNHKGCTDYIERLERGEEHC